MIDKLGGYIFLRDFLLKIRSYLTNRQLRVQEVNINFNTSQNVFAGAAQSPILQFNVFIIFFFFLSQR